MSKNIEQRTPEWFAQRKGKITGSVAGAALGLNPYMTASQLIRRMVREYHGLDNEFKKNVATEYGTLHEPLAQMEFVTKYGYAVHDVGFYAHPDYAWLGASPDGVFENSKGEECLLEIKCPFVLRNELLPQFKPLAEQPHYYAQVQIEMACTGVNQLYFYQWSQYADSLEIVTFNKAWFDEAVVKLFAFYELYLHELKNPIHLDDLVQTIDTDESLKLLQQYDNVCEVLDNATKTKAELLQQIVDLTGGKNSVIHGRKLTQVKRDGAISYAKAIKDLLPDADLTKYKGQPTTYWKLG